jgi:hypothetical protein
MRVLPNLAEVQEMARAKGIVIGAERRGAPVKPLPKLKSRSLKTELRDLPDPKSKPFSELWASLTPKQRMFCTAIVDLGAKPSEAYKIAYDTRNSATTSLKVNASVLRKKANVALAIQEGFEQKRQWTGNAVDAPEIRETSLRVLREIAEQGQMEACRVRSAELLGKVSTVGLFVERTENVQRSEHSPEAQVELASRLSALLGAVGEPQADESTLVIDTIAVPVLGAASTEQPDPELDLGAGI